jgi:putative tricarboxylic transport membrane protein
MALVSAGLLVQMLLLEGLGWIIATTLLFVAATLAFGSRRLLLDAGIGVVLTGLAFVVFNHGLGLTLPTGTVVEQLMPAEQADTQ